MLYLKLIGVVVFIGAILLFIAFYLTDLIKKRYKIYKARKNLLKRVRNTFENYYDFEDSSFLTFLGVKKGQSPAKNIHLKINKDCIVTYELPVKEEYKEDFYYPCIIHTRYSNEIDIISEGYIKVNKKLADSVGLKIKDRNNE